jgi:hypothetical protein
MAAEKRCGPKKCASLVVASERRMRGSELDEATQRAPSS